MMPFEAVKSYNYSFLELHGQLFRLTWQKYQLLLLQGITSLPKKKQLIMRSLSQNDVGNQ
jgi:hypothetical protein